MKPSSVFALLLQRLSMIMPLLATALLVMASYGLAKRSEMLSNQVSTVPGRADTPDYFVDRFAYRRVYQEGQLRTQLLGERMEHQQERDQATVQQPQFEQERRDAFYVKGHAKQGLLTNMDGQLILEGDAQLQRSTPGRDTLNLRSDRLEIDTDRQIAHSPGPASMTKQDGSKLEADRLNLDYLQGRVEAEGSVRTTLNNPPSKAKP